MPRAFSHIGGARPGRSVFNLSHTKTLTCDMGQLIPVMAVDCVPGDVMELAHGLVIRLRPLVAPVLHEINAYIHTFFVPYRLLWHDDTPITGDWETFITGGVDGTSAPTLPTFDPTDKDEGSLWDYLGFPTSALATMATGIEPVAWPQYAYNLIYNEYYRDQTQVAEVALTQEAILLRAWERDYFTSALPWQQRGTAPALPISGVIDIDGKAADITLSNTSDATARTVNTVNDASSGNRVGLTTQPSGTANARWGDPSLEVDLSGATTFDVADLRLAFQTQRWLERNARAGARYTEFLRAHFAVAPRDDRLDRPEFLGGMKSPVVVSEVLQTSATDTGTSSQTEQGNMSGHAITVDRRRIRKYRAEEFGVLMSILSVLPRTVYSQGVDRQWIKSTKLDYYFPEFAHLSEQAVVRGEIYADTSSTNNNTVFGYQGRYDELRYRPSGYAGEMRSTFDFWHLGRKFASAPALNQTFIEMDGTAATNKRIFASTTDDGLLVHVSNRLRAVRPLPIIADPGLIDH